MGISLILAVAENGVIGVKNGLPWKLSGDLKYFAKTTTGKTVVMGKNTFLSIIKMLGKPLPKRRNVVISDLTEQIEGIEVVNNIEAVKSMAKSEEIFIIGGASIYKQMIPLANKLYMTEVSCNCEGDAYFTEFNKDDWNLISEDKHFKDENNDYDYNFKIYERK